KRRLAELEGLGRLTGVIELVPVANPIGLGQMFQATSQGRFELGSGKNFNRDFTDLAELVAPALDGRLGADAAANVRLIRQAMLAALDGVAPAGSELQGLQRLLLRHACDADLVLDLHCDFDAVVHLYMIPQQAETFTALGARLGAGAILVSEDTGGSSFDEACSMAWLRLARRFPQAAVPLAGQAATVELGGMPDTERERAEASAEAILASLAEQGLIAGDWPAAPALACQVTPFAGAEYAYAPHAGVVS